MTGDTEMDAEAPFSRSAGGAGADPTMGMLAGTLVRTLEGILPVDYLTPGDRIVTRAGARRLTSMSVVVAQDDRPRPYSAPRPWGMTGPSRTFWCRRASRS